MDDRHALELLRLLADGLDPRTHEAFDPQSPYQSAETVRCLTYMINLLEQRMSTGQRKSQSPANSGKSWSKEEDERLARRFDSGISVKELAGEHSRTAAAIEARLVRLGRLKEADLPNRRWFDADTRARSS